MLKALHWLRSRQEERELAYWFALVYYDHRDRSFNNRAYFFGSLGFCVERPYMGVV
jgi:hypothetical protein